MDVFIARQPIFDRFRNVIAYELLFRDGFKNMFDYPDGNEATSSVMVNSFCLFGMQTLTRGKKAFVNVTRDVLVEGYIQLFRNDQIVPEILENVKADPEVLAACRRLKETGYRIALDDVVELAGREEIAELADILKVDFSLTTEEQRERLIERYKGSRIKFVAEKVETPDQFHRAVELGFDWFQGYFFSKPEVLDVCQDKRKTYRFLLKNGFDTPVTMSIRSALSTKKLSWPCFLKPWDGYASRGNAVVTNRRELSFHAKKIPNAICQEYIDGAEYTCDAYVDLNMKVRCVVPRRRVEVRAGEVSKGRVVKNPHIMSEAGKLVEALGAGPGVITLQLFLTSDDKVKFIEINPRFGGGAPLSIRAGANFPKWILQEVLGKKTRIRFDGFKDKLIMLRYDAEVWL